MKYLAAMFLVCGCAGADSGLDAMMVVDNAQFFRGKPPAVADGPAVVSFSFTSSRVAPGLQEKSGGGDVPIAATAIAFHLDGDIGYWVLQPAGFDPLATGDLSFSAKFSFSSLLPDGDHQISAQASGATGHYGAPSIADLQSSALPVDNSTLAISLSWDTQSDLDLHVLTPSGAIIWAKNINSDQNGGAGGGVLDFDSNSNCQIDGRRREDAYWTAPPASGHYIARVDTYSLCGQAQADWTVTATLNGMQLGKASGFSLPSDTMFTHDANAGVTALQFDIP